MINWTNHLMKPQPDKVYTEVLQEKLQGRTIGKDLSGVIKLTGATN